MWHAEYGVLAIKFNVSFAFAYQHLGGSCDAPPNSDVVVCRADDNIRIPDDPEFTLSRLYRHASDCLAIRIGTVCWIGYFTAQPVSLHLAFAFNRDFAAWLKNILMFQ